MRIIKKSVLLVIVAVISFFCGYLLKQKNNVVENFSDNDITEINKNDAMKRAFSADSIPPIDLVKDKETAARIAWAVLFPICKDEIAQNKSTYQGLMKSEWRAVYRENLIRGEAGIPLRISYEIDISTGIPLPAGPRLLDATNQPLNYP